MVMFGEKRRLKTLGRYPALGLSEARIEAKRFLVQYTDEPQMFEEPSITFKETKEQFLRDCAGRNKPRTVTDYTRLLEKHFPFKTPFDEFSRQKVMKVISSLAATPSEQSHAYVAIRTMMNWCVRQGLIESSLVPFIKHGTKPRERVLSESELKAVFSYALEFSYPFGAIIQLAILTGQRRSEIGLTRRSWINGDEVTFPEGFAKNKREHRFILSAMPQRVIESLPYTGDLLFPSANDTEKPFIGWAWHKARFGEGLENVDHYTLHDLRSTFAMGHAKIGTPIRLRFFSRGSPQPGRRDAPFTRSYRDEDTIEKGTQEVVFVFTATHRQIGEGRFVPQAGTAGLKPCGMD